ncbi:MAG: NDP-sugar synthase [Proteobacteria bacterium]|jgi:mannose-1-phosphate guanylyltransferase/phosphomannomutase|nr:NDP-sugar synthase [Pseudomonadota bacterium]
MSGLKQAMVLTAGMSTRMRPLTTHIPKILLPCLGKNLFDRMLDYCQVQGIESVSMNVFHGKDALFNQIDRNKHAVKVKAFEEAPIRGTGGGIAGMQTFITDDHFAVINCDFITEAVLADMFKYHISHKALATLLLIPHPKTGKYGTVKIDPYKKIVSFNPNAPQRNIFAGIHIMSREIFKEMPSDHNFCIIENVYKPLIEKGAPIFAYCKDVPWYDLGEVKLYHDALFSLLQKPLPWMKDVKNGKSWIDPGVAVPPQVSYLNVILEKGAQFEEGESRLQDVIAFPNTTIKKGSYQHAILTPTDTILDLHRIKV